MHLLHASHSCRTIQNAMTPYVASSLHQLHQCKQTRSAGNTCTVDDHAQPADLSHKDWVMLTRCGMGAQDTGTAHPKGTSRVLCIYFLGSALHKHLATCQECNTTGSHVLAEAVQLGCLLTHANNHTGYTWHGIARVCAPCPLYTQASAPGPVALWFPCQEEAARGSYPCSSSLVKIFA
jgi:hypothetical protein